MCSCAVGRGLEAGNPGCWKSIFRDFLPSEHLVLRIIYVLFSDVVNFLPGSLNFDQLSLYSLGNFGGTE